MTPTTAPVETTRPAPSVAPEQFLAADLVITEMAEAGAARALDRSAVEVLVLSMMAGGFITVGALFSVLLAAGTANEGLVRLLEGFGFSVGFFLVIMTGALLFTEVNVEMPAALLHGGPGRLGSAIAKLWLLAAAGNLLGAFLIGWAINMAEVFSPQVTELLTEVVASKMRYASIGGAGGWWQAVLSGVLANWLVGMAAFVATMGRTVLGRYIPIFLIVSAFVATGVMHSPANMAYFSLAHPLGIGPSWPVAFGWSILPAALGNILGAFFLVALPFWVLRRSQESHD